MASTIAFYTGDGATTDFTVPFDYLAKKFVRVSLGVTILKGGDYGDTSKDYYFLDKTKVRLKVPPQVGEVLTIRRYTSATDRVVSFKDASVLKATDLDVSAVQTIHIAEEARDIINDALIKDKEGNWDAKGNRIVNVGTPEADSDAMTYGVYKADALGAYQSKLDAERARDRAVEAETNSKKSEENAKLSEENAQASADTAVSASDHSDAVKVENQAILKEAKEIRDENKVLDTNTKNNANVAQVKANEAKVSETNAKKSEVNAKASEVSASESASLANAQVSLAVQEVTKAKEQVSLATQQATLATTKASEAEDSATSASQSATVASTSANNASASAGTATTQATNASNSAKAAKLSADNAALSKTAAGTSATNARASEVEAKKQADLAKGYANQAASGQVNADWNETVSTSKAFIKNKPTLGALASKDSIAYSEITGTPPEQDLSGLATKNELQTGLASKANSSHTHTIANVTGLQVDLTAIRESITNVSYKVDGIGDTLSPTYAKKQAILDACDKALNGTNPVNAVDPTFLNQLADKLSKLGTIRPLGFHYLHPYGTVPADSIICNGATYSRALYKDFFDYITTQGWVKTEAEWQEIATRDNGFCPFYSSGDGSTNFRTPKFAPYQQIALASGSVGKYHQAGLPNITGSVSVSGGENDLSRITGTLVSSGALTASSNTTTTWAGYEHVSGSYWSKLSISASNSDKTYGRSSTVQPESHEWVVCVVAYGIATNVGSVDIQNVMSAVNDVQASLTQIKLDIAQIPQPRTYVTKTWSSGTEWYRVWSDGFIEQGGHGTGSTCTFSKPFSNKNYTFNVQPSSGYSSHPDWIAAYENGPSRTTTGTKISLYEGGDQGWDWRASGY